MTVRQAIAALRSEGLAEARHGAGVFVRAFTPVRRRGIQRLSRANWSAGTSIWATDETREVSIDQITVAQDIVPPETVAAALSLGQDETVCRRARRYLVEGRPVMIATSYLPQRLVADSPITRPDTGPGGTFARLSDLGFPPAHHREEIRFGVAGPEAAERLRLPMGSPVLNLVRTSYTTEGLAVEVNEMVLDAGAYVLEYDFDA
jgi:GntR family transcriptional regulator